MENRKERLISLIIILFVLMCLEIWFFTKPSIPILSIFAKTLGAAVISLYVFGITKVYFQK